MSDARDFTLHDLAAILDDVHRELQLSVNQSVLKHDMVQGLSALGGIDAIQRLETRLAIQWPEYRFPARGVELERARPPAVSPLRGKRA
jgi:hypothetical protein